jgi:hypothetical protein
MHSLRLFTVVVIPQDFYCINLESAARQWFQAKSKKSAWQSGKNIYIRKKKNIRLQNLLALLIQHKNGWLMQELLMRKDSLLKRRLLEQSQ